MTVWFKKPPERYYVVVSTRLGLEYMKHYYVEATSPQHAKIQVEEILGDSEDGYEAIVYHKDWEAWKKVRGIIEKK